MSGPESRIRVLVADDERSIAISLAAILEAAGFEAKAVFCGEDAVNAARTFLPDILLTDFAMPPGINGLEAAAEINQMLPGIRVLLLSAHVLGAQVAPYEAKGYRFLLLSKPIHPIDLLHTLRSESDLEAQLTHRPSILNVDDVESHRYSLTRLLMRAGFEVTEAGTGVDALKSALEKHPELVLLDINLPDANGYDICKELKSNPETCRATVVHLTASDNTPESEARSFSVGADDYLTHPVEPAALIRRLRELLQTKYLEPK